MNRARKQLQKHEKRLAKEVAGLKKRIREDPSRYPDKTTFGIFAGKIVYGWTDDEKLYVIHQDQKIILDNVLDVSIDRWIEGIENKVRQEQQINYSTLRGDPLPKMVTIDGSVALTSQTGETRWFKAVREFIEIDDFTYITGDKLVIKGKMRYVEAGFAMPHNIDYFPQTEHTIPPEEILHVYIE